MKKKTLFVIMALGIFLSPLTSHAEYIGVNYQPQYNRPAYIGNFSYSKPYQQNSGYYSNRPYGSRVVRRNKRYRRPNPFRYNNQYQRFQRGYYCPQYGRGYRRY